MPISYELVGKVARFTVDGEIDGAAIQLALERATRDPAFQAGMRILMHDLGSTFQASSDQAYEVALHLRSLMENYSPHIAVVVHEDVKYGMGRMIAAYCEREGIDFQVFRDFGNAEQWLEYVHHGRDEDGRIHDEDTPGP
jgi:hypothetical protein